MYRKIVQSCISPSIFYIQTMQYHAKYWSLFNLVSEISFMQSFCFRTNTFAFPKKIIKLQVIQYSIRFKRLQYRITFIKIFVIRLATKSHKKYFPAIL